MKKRIKTVKAYTATREDDARFPNQNFLDVIDKELTKGAFDTLVIGGGSVDISNLDTYNDPEKNVPELRGKAIDSAQKLFSLAEASLQSHPTLRKVILMKRTPRYDPTEGDPLNLKPQLSSLADSASFGFWCDSPFKDRIILGGQDIPTGDEHHYDVYGSHEDSGYDGLHMRGCGGRSFMTKSIEKVLFKAGLINTKEESNPNGWKKPHKNIPQGGKGQSYNPMGILIDRIRSQSSAKFTNDEVFENQCNRRDDFRPSVIQPPKKLSNLQEHYNIPVHNTFSDLLN